MSFFTVEIWIAALGLLILLLDSFTQLSKRSLTVIAAAGTAAGLIAAPFLACCAVPEWVKPFYHSDEAAFYFKTIILAATLIVLLIQLDYLPVLRQYMFARDPDGGLGELAALPLIVTSGLLWMVSARDFTTMFVALELSTIGFYVLVAAMRRNAGSLEAGAKYLILGALSTGFLIYGIAWLFGLTGTFDFAAMRDRVALNNDLPHAAFVFAFALTMAGLAFKMAAAPFQFWAPDVYQGAPTPVTAFLAIASKVAAVMVMARVLPVFFAHPAMGPGFVTTVSVMAAVTMIVGSFGAIPQRNVKRLLGYSSIVNGGFLLWALAVSGWTASGLNGTGVAGLYLAGYAVGALLCFHVLSVVRRETGAEDLRAFHGLARQNPLLAGAMTIGMASLAGLPLTAGFVGKFFVFGGGVSAGQTCVTAAAVVAAVTGFYYYFKVIRSMFWEKPDEEAPGDLYQHLSLRTKGLILLLSVATLFFGVYPKPLIAPLEKASGACCESETMMVSVSVNDKSETL